MLQARLISACFLACFEGLPRFLPVAAVDFVAVFFFVVVSSLSVFFFVTRISVRTFAVTIKDVSYVTEFLQINLEYVADRGIGHCNTFLRGH